MLLQSLFSQFHEIFTCLPRTRLSFTSAQLLNHLKAERQSILFRSQFDAKINHEMNTMQLMVPYPLLDSQEISSAEFLTLYKQLQENFFVILAKEMEPRIMFYFCLIALFYLCTFHERMRNELDDGFTQAVETFWHQHTLSLQACLQNLFARIAIVNKQQQQDVPQQSASVAPHQNPQQRGAAPIHVTQKQSASAAQQHPQQQQVRVIPVNLTPLRTIPLETPHQHDICASPSNHTLQNSVPDDMMCLTPDVEMHESTVQCEDHAPMPLSPISASFFSNVQNDSTQSLQIIDDLMTDDDFRVFMANDLMHSEAANMLDEAIFGGEEAVAANRESTGRNSADGDFTSFLG